ncbi:MAG: glycosyl hydrolase 2 galactose-binding domain-containing protein [Pirellulales bacterium]
MKQPHCIRLHGPWQSTPASSSEETRVKLPGDWSAVCSGEVPRTLTRFFNSPTGLDPNEKVELVFENVPVEGTVAFNEQPIGQLTGQKTSVRIDVTSHLKLRNEIKIEVIQFGAIETETPEVRIEIH